MKASTLLRGIFILCVLLGALFAKVLAKMSAKGQDIGGAIAASVVVGIIGCGLAALAQHLVNKEKKPPVGKHPLRRELVV